MVGHFVLFDYTHANLLSLHPRSLGPCLILPAIHHFLAGHHVQAEDNARPGKVIGTFGLTLDDVHRGEHLPIFSSRIE